EALTELVPVEPYDLVYSFGVIHHTPHPDRVLEQIRHYLRSGGTLKMMVYHRRSWKVMAMAARNPRRIANLDELIAERSEAQTGSPVTYTYTRRSLRRLLEQRGYRVESLRVEHIFPWRFPDYAEYRYVKAWPFRW